MSGSLSVLFIGGGTGGHIYPNLAVAERMAELAAEQGQTRPRRVFVTSERPIDARILGGALERGEADAHATLPMRPLSPRPVKLMRCLASWGPSVRAARALIRSERHEADRVVAVSTGGFVSAPAAQACRVEGVPIAAVQLDAAAGVASRFVAARASRRFAASAAAAGDGWEAIPPVVRRIALAGASPERARAELGLDPDRQTLLVVGGSQGAGSINELVPALARANPEALRAGGWQILHLSGPGQAGPGRAEGVRTAYADARADAVVLESLDAMGLAWSAATLAIGRGGAGTVAEAMASATPIAVLPYPHHRDRHQARNAQPLVDRGLAVVLTDHADLAANLAAHAERLAALLAAPPAGPQNRGGPGSQQIDETAGGMTGGMTDGAAVVARAVLGL